MQCRRPRFYPWKIPWRRRWLFLYRVRLCFQAPPSHTDKDQVLPGLLSWVSLDKERHIGLSKGIQISSISPTTLKSSAVLLLLLCFQSCPTLCDPIDGSPPAPQSLGFSRQEHWSGLPFPSPMHESEK